MENYLAIVTNRDGKNGLIMKKEENMKQKLKYIEAVLMAMSIGLLFMPLIEISEVGISVIDILKIPGGGIEGSILQEVQNYLDPYAYASGIFIFLYVIFIFAEALNIAILEEKKAFLVAIVGWIINNIVAVGSCIWMKAKINEVKSAISLFGVSKIIRFCTTTIFLWIVLYVLILLIAIYGIKSQEAVQMGNPVKDFNGGVLGASRRFQGVKYLFHESCQIFFQYENGQVQIRKEKGMNSVADIRFFKEYQKYCVEPLEHLSIFLESGQPLGENRKYYLPRGCKIVIKESENTFILA